MVHADPARSSTQHNRGNEEALTVNHTKIVATKSLGNTAFATKDVKCGEIVLADLPVLTILSIDHITSNKSFMHDENNRSVQAVIEGFFEACHLARVSIRLIEPIFSMVVDPSVTEDIAVQMEESLFAPSAPLSRSERQLGELVLMNEDISRKCFPPWSTSCGFWKALREGGKDGVLRIIRLMHACRVNLHDADGTSSIYLTASKFSHSCNANTFWVSEVYSDTPLLTGELRLCAIPRVARRAIHIAIRDISVGELLTFGYQGTGLNMLLPTVMRRERLQCLNFVCCCERCRLFDDGLESSRDICCPSCAGVSAPSLRLVVQEGGWVCRCCHELLHREEVLARLLFDERALTTLVMHMFYSMRGEDDARAKLQSVDNCSAVEELSAFRAFPLLQRFQLAMTVQRVLGPKHFTFASAGCGIIRCIRKAIDLHRSEGHVDLTQFLDMKRKLQSTQTHSSSRQLRGTDGNENVPTAATLDSVKGSSLQGAMCWAVELMRVVRLVDEWFTENMPQSFQHVTLRLLVVALVELLLYPKFGIRGLLFNEEIDVIAQSFEALSSSESGEHDWSAQYVKLRKWKEFA